MLGICADHPAMCKLRKFKGVSSYNACWKCDIRGVYGGTEGHKGGMYFEGYKENIMQHHIENKLKVTFPWLQILSMSIEILPC